jgi:hypothetical protein
MSQRERASLRALSLMRWIATTLGRPVARLVLHPISLYFLLFQGSAVRGSTRYLTQVFGRPPRWIERYRHVHAFASTVLDRVYLLQGRFSSFDIRVSGGKHYEAVAGDGRGVLFLGAHLGSFEVLRVLGEERRQLRVAMVMYEQNARRINATLRAIAPELELKVIALGRLESMLELRDWLDSGASAGLLADRIAPAQLGGPRDTTVVLPFLGRPAVFSDGAFRLAALLRRPMVFMVGLYLGGNRYDLRFLSVADFRERTRGPGAPAALEAAVRAAMLRYIEILESLCREAPYNWFNFFDFWATDAADHPAPH